MKNTEKTMEKIVALCKNRGFVYPGSEIYGGLANTWDYGPLGMQLKNNIKQAWLKKFVQENKYNVGLDSAILMNPQTFPTAYRNLALLRTTFPCLQGTLFFVLRPGILRKKRNMISALSVILARIRRDYRFWMPRRGFAGSAIIPWPYTGNSGMTVTGLCRRRAL